MDPLKYTIEYVQAALSLEKMLLILIIPGQLFVAQDFI